MKSGTPPTSAATSDGNPAAGAPAQRAPGSLVRAAAAAAVRGFALFLGAFAFVNACLGAPADANRWWIDVRPLGATVASVALAACGVVLAGWALRRRASRRPSAAAAAVAALLAVATGADAVAVFRLDADGEVRAPGVPLSALVAAGLAAVAVRAMREARRESPGATGAAVPSDTSVVGVPDVPVERSEPPSSSSPSSPSVGSGGPAPSVRCNESLPSLRATLVAAAACAVLFPVAQMATFGRADYRRDAGAIVVFGARTYADGRPSLALSDRMRTGCDLWLDGYAPVLFVSGGPGDGAVHETDAMRALAIAAGVAPEAIVTDRDGVDTASTVRNAVARFPGARLLAVSHAYHLPRVRLEFDHAGGKAFTVPADETRILGKMPWFVAREVAAWWRTWGRSPQRVP